MPAWRENSPSSTADQPFASTTGLRVLSLDRCSPGAGPGRQLDRDGSLLFKLVHIVLAVGLLILVVSVWGFARESTRKREGSPVGTGSSSPA